MKKALSSIILLLSVIILVFSLSACKDNKEAGKQIEASHRYECPHEWAFLNSQVATSCLENGQETYKCDLCGETKEVVLEKKPCELVAAEWLHDTNRALAYVTIRCKNDPSHFYASKTAPVIKTKTKEATCKEKGEYVLSATVYYEGQEFTYEEKGESKGGCSYVSYYTLLGDSCLDGIRETSACKWCGEIKNMSLTYQHKSHYGDTRAIPEESVPCGGTINTSTCLCGEITSDNISLSCRFYTDSVLEEENGVRTEETVTKICVDCGLSRTQKTVYSASGATIKRDYEYRDAQGNLIYEGGFYNHENEGHYVRESIEPYGAHCNDGYYKILDCYDCDYYTKARYSGTQHIREKTTIDLSLYCGCDEIVTIVGACPCGYYRTPYIDIVKDYLDSTPIHTDHSYELIDPNGLVSSPFTVSSYEKAYKFDCGLCFFEGYSEPIGAYVYELLVIKYGDEIIYEWIPTLVGEEPENEVAQTGEVVPNFGQYLGATSAQEKKRAQEIVDYLTALLKTETDPKLREIYQSNIDKKKQEFGLGNTESDLVFIDDAYQSLLNPLGHCQDGCKFAYGKATVPSISFPQGYYVKNYGVLACYNCGTKIVWAQCQKDGENGYLLCSYYGGFDVVYTWILTPDEEPPKEDDELPKDEWGDLEDKNFGRPLTDEEKQAIEDYFNSLQGNKNSENLE